MIIVAGFLKETATAASGTSVLLSIKGPGELLGHLAAIDGNSQHATVLAGTRCRVRVIGAQRFEDFLKNHEKADKALRSYIIEELRTAAQTRIDSAGAPALAKIAHALAELATRHGIETAEGIAIGMPLTQVDLSALTGLSQRAVEVALSVLRQQGMIATRYRQLTVRNLNALREMITSETQQVMKI